MPATRRLAAEPREAAAAARLRLAETLLSTSDPVKCAQATVDWLGTQGAKRCLCTLIDARGRASAVVTYGIPKAQAGSLGMVLEEPVHPLLFAFAGHDLAIPLPVTEKREARTGLLLVAPSRSVGDAVWAATQLGHKLVRREEPLKSQFLANMSHELRTPLNAILGYTSMLLAGVSGELLPAQKQKLQRVEANGKILLAIVNDLLDLNRLDAGKLPLHPGEFELRSLIGALVRELPEADLQVLVELQEPLAPADRHRVKQVLEEFVQPGGGESGLALAICRRLANLLNGRIEVISEAGKGTTFTLVVPRKGKRR